MVRFRCDRTERIRQLERTSMLGGPAIAGLRRSRNDMPMQELVNPRDPLQVVPGALPIQGNAIAAGARWYA